MARMDAAAIRTDRQWVAAADVVDAAAAHVGSLRKKIDATPSTPTYILTEPWVGYRFSDV